MVRNWWRQLRRAATPRRQGRAHSFRPECERLEDRWLPSITIEARLLFDAFQMEVGSNGLPQPGTDHPLLVSFQSPFEVQSNNISASVNGNAATILSVSRSGFKTLLVIP